MSICKPSHKGSQWALWYGEHPHLGSLICFDAEAQVFQEGAPTTSYKIPRCRSLLYCSSSTVGELNPHWDLARIKKAIPLCQVYKDKRGDGGKPLLYRNIFLWYSRVWPPIPQAVWPITRGGALHYFSQVAECDLNSMLSELPLLLLQRTREQTESNNLVKIYICHFL